MEYPLLSESSQMAMEQLFVEKIKDALNVENPKG